MRIRKTFELLGPTERAILQLLWEAGPQTVRQVQAHFQRARPEVGYTTILTPLQELHGKGLVTCTRHEQQHVYQVVSRSAVLHAAFQGIFDELGATEAERIEVVEALRHR
jgi:predicted transcriptional regulator